MKKETSRALIVCLLFVVVCGSVSEAQERPKPGDISAMRIVNLVAVGEGNLNITIDGRNRFKKGFELGRKTGAIAIKKGTYEFVLSKSGCETATKAITLEGGKSQTLVSYAEPIRDDTGVIVSWDLKLARLAQYDPEDGRYMTLVSFCEAQETPLLIKEIMAGTEAKTVVRRLKVERLTLPEGDSLSEIYFDDERVTKLGAREKGNYVVLLFEDAEGKKSSVNFYDPKFVLAE